MNSKSSFEEVLGSVLVSSAGSQTPKRALFRRMIPVVTMATATIGLSACSSTAPSTTGQALRPTGITVLSTHSNKSSETPSYFEIVSPDARADIHFFADPEPDYLTTLLRDLPWSTR